VKRSFDVVRKIGRSMPDVEEGTTYGSPALKVAGKMFACLASHRSADPGSLVLRMGFDERQQLMAADPDTYYLTDHYLDYPVVLVRLNRIHHDALQDLLVRARQFTMASGKRRTRGRKTA